MLGVLPDRHGRSIYIFSSELIVQYDLASQTPVNQVPRQVLVGAHPSVLSDGRILVTDHGFNLTPSSGNIYFISPDLQQVDTLDVGDLVGERNRATIAAVADVPTQRAYVISPDVSGFSGWGDPAPVRLLVLDLATKELVKILDLGMFTRSPPLYRYPNC